jgi:hypothetical protein
MITYMTINEIVLPQQGLSKRGSLEEKLTNLRISI